MFSVLVRVGMVVAVGVVCGCGSGSEGPVKGGPVSGPEGTGSKAAKPAVVKPRVPAGVVAGYAVFDRRAGRTVLEHRAHQTFRSASVVKILMALDHLRGGGDGRLLGPMLRSSDDAAATELWRRGGQEKIIERMAPRMGLTETRPPPADKPGFWGYTALSAADVVRTYRYVLDEAPERDRELIMGHLEKATPCGTDGFDQRFGIPRALPRPWAVKQGWSGFGTTPAVPCEAGAVTRPASGPGLGLGRPVLHTSGLVGDRIVVVLTLHPAGTSFRAASSRLTGLTRQVHRAAGRAGPG